MRQEIQRCPGSIVFNHCSHLSQRFGSSLVTSSLMVGSPRCRIADVERFPVALDRPGLLRV